MFCKSLKASLSIVYCQSLLCQLPAANFRGRFAFKEREARPGICGTFAFTGDLKWNIIILYHYNLQAPNGTIPIPGRITQDTEEVENSNGNHRANLRPSAKINLPCEVSPDGQGQKIHRRQGNGYDWAARGRLHPHAAGSGGDSQRRQTDAHARTSGVRCTACLRMLLPRVPEQVVSHPARARAYGKRAGAHRAPADGVD